MTANLLTDVAGVRVGIRARREARLRRHGGDLRRARRRLDRGPRRRAGLARHRTARAAHDGRAGGRASSFQAARPSASTRRAARWRISPRSGAATGSLRASCRSSQARACSTSPMAATRPGDGRRPIGSSAIGPPSRLTDAVRARDSRGGLRRDHLRPQGRPRLGERRDLAGLSSRRDRRRATPVGRTTRGASPYFWAAPLRARRRVRRPRAAGSPGADSLDRLALGLKNSEPANTNLAVVVTDAAADQGRRPNASP